MSILDIQLSTHLTLRDMVATGHANLQERNALDGWKMRAFGQVFARETLEPMIQHFGMMRIVLGFTCRPLAVAMGESADSPHTKMQAVKGYFVGVPYREVASMMKKSPIKFGLLQPFGMVESDSTGFMITMGPPLGAHDRRIMTTSDGVHYVDSA